ncbi:translation initiation factor 5B [Methanococcus voltae]|uniref:translation initiation factor IF-2 n=1 Tax=Methanococcus voltae TaxID=2188 RepID=UPI001AE1AF6E|nr:translation initiation factor IF-2 [Methanococcus voltae]MBP2143317.1 translation initiation factor 5B [Methanococcus voltae]
MALRCPIVSVLGHVDHGKTSLLDKIRTTRVTTREAGGITQHIGASEIPIGTIKKVSKDLLSIFKADLSIPGILVIDTPGHEAFTSLRKRGGALADIAILVVDINEGFKPQTIEAINILKQCKTPFVVAANKLDKISGWNSVEGPFVTNFNEQKQHPNALTDFEIKLYENVIAPLNELGFEADVFSRVKDTTTTINILPVSAMTGEGIPDLLIIIAGLAQKFLEQKLGLNVDGYAKGTVLEIKEEKGLGKTIDAIIYDGIAKAGDYVVIGNPDGIITSKVKALLKPKALDEMMDPRDKFKPSKQIVAATGVKISAPDLDNVIAGSPLRIVPKSQIEVAKEEIVQEIEDFEIKLDEEGIIIKADTMGSLEALATELRKKDVKIKKAEVGDVNKKDVIEAASYAISNPYNGAIIAFNAKVLNDAKLELEKNDVKLFEDKIIYKLVEDYEDWIKELEESLKSDELNKLTKPAILKILPNCIFRQKAPAVCGVEVLYGTLKVGSNIMLEDGKRVGYVKELRNSQQETIKEAKVGMQVPISIDGSLILGRHAKEEDILYVEVPEPEVRKFYHEYKSELRGDELEALNRYTELKQKVENNVFWGM